ncbi:AAA family ATPase [Paraburkholderia humisilvae]|uniref:ATP-dependent zinc metalloprotease FtsH n=1 Tax=Paraburkholderia humisilvae TaxID=627669 RepID=A0A6J5DM93_9BURK|nr:AAA family ATPase [Paraburkholderia humisilvae]CAB3753946.1 ATP-dependent zinc metalloprotease FtsH [Paraburkholderia humisilvae]
MKTTRKCPRPRLARYAAATVAAVVLCAAVSLTVKRHEAHRNDARSVALSGVAGEMRKDASPWADRQKDASQLLLDLDRRDVAAIGIRRDAILVSTVHGDQYYVADDNGALANLLLNRAFKQGTIPPWQLVWLRDADVRTGLGQAAYVMGEVRATIAFFLPMLLIGGLFWFVRREMTGGAQLLRKSPKLRFDDVIGAGEAKAALADVRAWLTEPAQFKDIGARAPCGVLMTGGPGVGKTRLAQALAGECGANFIAITGGYFSSKYYGVGIQKVKRLFELARKHAPTVIFIDEADGLGKRTDTGSGPTEAESNRILNELLAQMDGFASNEGVIVVAATNHPDNIDEALRRHGRFDRTVQVQLPGVEDRAKILKFYASNLKTSAAGIDFDQLARLTTGLSPATLSMIVNQAGLVARKAGESEVCAEHFVEAVKIARIGDINGAERVLTDEERRRIAVHEAGHGLVAALLDTGILEEVTILPRGGALGVALITKKRDKYLYSETEMRNEVQVLLGGRNAELLMLDEASSGAAQDLQEASRISLDMVSTHGFNADGNLFSLSSLPQQVAGLQLKTSIAQANVLLQELNEACFALLRSNRPVLDAIADQLLAAETVPGETVYRLLREHAAAVARSNALAEEVAV